MDVYRILNVSRNASTTEIKQAYRKLALKYHPDMNPTRRGEAEEHFKKITNAYQTLLEHKQRVEGDGGSSTAYTGAPKYGNSSQRHSHWDPKPTRKTNPVNDSTNRRQYDPEAAYKAYQAYQSRQGGGGGQHRQQQQQPNQDRPKEHQKEHQSGQEQRHHTSGGDPFVDPDHFNVHAWQAGHYGEDMSKITDNVQYKSSWASNAGKHQQYYTRKNNESKQKQAKQETPGTEEPIRQAYDAGSNLRKKREDRMNNHQKSTQTTEDITKCSIS